MIDSSMVDKIIINNLLTSDAPMSPVNILKVVVFPAPFTPSRPKHWPSGTLKESLSTANKKRVLKNRLFFI